MSASELAKRVLAGDRRAGARLMRLVDDGNALGVDALAELHPARQVGQVVGVTGSAGAGKSTLVDRLIEVYRARGERVGVVVVDPSSPITGGALLGDRVRMQRHVLDDHVFVRSLASRGRLGGLSRSAAAMVAILEAMGFQRVIVETVGAGQAEVEIAELASTVLLVLAPGNGDDVQALKAGVMEVADVFVVNKADRPGADRTAHEVESILALGGREREDGWRPPIISTVAVTGEGVDTLLSAIDRHEGALRSGPGLLRRHTSRAMREIEIALETRWREDLLARAGGRAALLEAAARVVERRSHPGAEAARLLASVAASQDGLRVRSADGTSTLSISRLGAGTWRFAIEVEGARAAADIALEPARVHAFAVALETLDVGEAHLAEVLSAKASGDGGAVIDVHTSRGTVEVRASFTVDRAELDGLARAFASLAERARP